MRMAQLSHHKSLTYQFKFPVFLCVCLSLLTFPAYGDHDELNFNGFYAGVGIGAIRTEGNLDASTSITYDAFASGDLTTVRGMPLDFQAKIYNDTLLASGHIGYGHRYLPWSFYLGVELYGNATANRSVTETHLASRIEPVAMNPTLITAERKTNISLRDGEYGLDILPGFLVSPTTLLYARVGTAINTAKINTSTLFSFTLLDPALSEENTADVLGLEREERVTGLRLGVGLKKHVSDHWTIGLDYIYTNYGRIHSDGTGNTTTVGGTVVNGLEDRTDVRFTSQTILLQTDYIFNPPRPLCVKYCSSCPNNYDYFDGFYVRVEGGGVELSTKVDQDAAATFRRLGLNNSTLTMAERNRSVTDDGELAAYAGFGKFIYNSVFYLGAEAFVENGKHELSNSLRTGELSINLSPITAHLSQQTNVSTVNRFAWGFDFRPGIEIMRKTLVYGLVGFAVNKLNANSEGTFDIVNDLSLDTSVHVSKLNATASKNVAGLRLGIGIEEYLGCNLSVNIGYTYTLYGHIKLNTVGATESVDGVGTIVTIGDGFLNHVGVNINTQALTLGLTYHFCSC